MTSSESLAHGLSIARTVALAGLSVALATTLTASQPVSPSELRAAPPIVAAAMPSAPAMSAPDPAWQKRWWIEKTARLLRGGDGLGPADDVDALLKLPEETIARTFMNDPRFGDTILDFNMFYLGFKVDALKSDGLYKRNAFDFPNAVAAAQALLQGGDYFKLFDLEGPFYMAPLPVTFDDPLPPEDAALSPEALRMKVMDEAEGRFFDLMAMGSKPVSPAALCEAVRKITETPTLHDRLVRAFNDPEIFFLIRGRVLTGPTALLERAADEECDEKPAAEVNVQRLTDAAATGLSRLTRAFAEILRFEPSVYQPRTVLEFKPFDLAAFQMDRWMAFGFEQSTALRNSSTNLNRKRGAYMLKRFFCDDLTPVGFEVPKEHVSGAHGSDTTCYNCHYKLDPMAGFFRTRGAYFFDYAKEEGLIFDDLATVDREKYETAWRAPKNSTRTWNIGYIRSPRFEEHNLYGESVADLTGIVRSAPEAKRCLMRRLFEYFVADDQTLDGGYLDEFTRTFEQEAAQNSSVAMKNAIVRVLLSKTYHQANADPQQCYDFAPGGKHDGAPPCRVAFILQKNCAQCHGAGGNGVANLDLTTWILAPDGRTHTFPHLDREHRQMAAPETLARMAERLSSSDPARRMPMQMVMDSRERQELFLWAQEQLTRASKRQRP